MISLLFLFVLNMIFLQRNLLYTTVTHRKYIVFLIAQKRAVELAVHKNVQSKRLIELAYRIHTFEYAV